MTKFLRGKDGLVGTRHLFIRHRLGVAHNNLRQGSFERESECLWPGHRGGPGTPGYSAGGWAAPGFQQVPWQSGPPLHSQNHQAERKCGEQKAATLILPGHQKSQRLEMLWGEGLRKMPAVGSADSRGSIGTSWLALPVHQVTCVKRVFTHVVILGTAPYTSTALSLESRKQAFPPLSLFLTLIPTENKKQA